MDQRIGLRLVRLTARRAEWEVLHLALGVKGVGRSRPTYRKHIDEKVEHVALADGGGDIGTVHGTAIAVGRLEESSSRKLGDEDCAADLSFVRLHGGRDLAYFRMPWRRAPGLQKRSSAARASTSVRDCYRSDGRSKDLDVGVGLHHTFYSRQGQLGLFEVAFVSLCHADGVRPELVRESRGSGRGARDERRGGPLARRVGFAIVIDHWTLRRAGGTSGHAGVGLGVLHPTRWP